MRTYLIQRFIHSVTILFGISVLVFVLVELAPGDVVDSMISTGCPTGSVVGGPADGLRLITKSGGFGQPDALTRIVERLRSDADTPAVDRPQP